MINLEFFLDVSFSVLRKFAKSVLTDLANLLNYKCFFIENAILTKAKNTFSSWWEATTKSEKINHDTEINLAGSKCNFTLIFILFCSWAVLLEHFYWQKEKQECFLTDLYN